MTDISFNIFEVLSKYKDLTRLDLNFSKFVLIEVILMIFSTEAFGDEQLSILSQTFTKFVNLDMATLNFMGLDYKSLISLIEV